MCRGPDPGIGHGLTLGAGGCMQEMLRDAEHLPSTLSTLLGCSSPAHLLGNLCCARRSSSLTPVFCLPFHLEIQRSSTFSFDSSPSKDQLQERLIRTSKHKEE